MKENERNKKQRKPKKTKGKNIRNRDLKIK